jgi:hypothetical protein
VCEQLHLDEGVDAIPIAEKEDIKQVVLKLLNEIRSPWLMVIDNADDSDIFLQADKKSNQRALREYLPTSCNGSSGTILFTTRDHKAATDFAGANITTIEKMDRPESTDLLRKSIQMQNHSLLDDEASVTTLLDLLLDLPLAIKQAAFLTLAFALALVLAVLPLEQHSYASEHVHL